MLVTCAGILVADIIAGGLPKVSAPGEVTFAPSGVRLSVGGHAANVSVDLLALGLKRGQVSCVGSVGQDIFGDFILRELRKRGVVGHIQRLKGKATSSNMIIVVQGEDRRFHVDVGANLFLNPRGVRAILRKEKPLVFYVGAAGLLGQFDDELSQILKEAKQLNSVTFVDPIQPHRREWEFLAKSSRWIDILHCNNIEAESVNYHLLK